MKGFRSATMVDDEGFKVHYSNDDDENDDEMKTQVDIETEQARVEKQK